MSTMCLQKGVWTGSLNTASIQLMSDQVIREKEKTPASSPSLPFSMQVVPPLTSSQPRKKIRGLQRIGFMEVRVDLELSLGGSRKGIQDQQILGSFLVKERR